MNNQNSGVVVGEGTEEVAGKPISGAAANQAVIREVSSWGGVTVHDHRFGGVEFRVGRRELGHLHARFADLPFPRRIRNAARHRRYSRAVLRRVAFISLCAEDRADSAGDWKRA